jgi:hypothetical protein
LGGPEPDGLGGAEVADGGLGLEHEPLPHEDAGSVGYTDGHDGAGDDGTGHNSATADPPAEPVAAGPGADPAAAPAANLAAAGAPGHPAAEPAANAAAGEPVAAELDGSAGVEPDAQHVPSGELTESLVDDPEPAVPPQPVDAMPFPPLLDLDVTPSDGQPWVDPDLLGADTVGRAALTGATVLDGDGVDGDGVDGDGLGGDGLDGAGLGVESPTDPPAALLADLHAADGGGDGSPSLAALATSEDPAIRALAAHWSG